MVGEKLQEALIWAAELHCGQWGDGPDPLPYLAHPLDVLSILRREGGVIESNMLCAAVLHDTLEQTTATPEEVERRFGATVSKLVRQLTRREPDEDTLAGLGKQEVWRLRADMLIEDVAAMGKRAMTIKLCDRTSNVRDARFTKSGKKLERYVWQTWRILDTISRDVHPGLWDGLRREAESFGERR